MELRKGYFTTYSSGMLHSDFFFFFFFKSVVWKNNLEAVSEDVKEDAVIKVNTAMSLRVLF